MTLIEILVIIACVLIVGGVILKAIINKRQGKCSCGDCSYCAYSGNCHKKKNKN